MSSASRLRCAALTLLLAGWLATRLAAAPAEAWLDRTHSLSLDGRWDFAYVAGPRSAVPPALTATIAVPGHWELQGFAEPHYGKDLAEGTGYYRRTFRVPAAWADRRVFLHFAGVLYGCEVTVNGTPVGSWASGYNPVAFDVTDALRPEAENTLEVTVTTRSHGWEFDTNDCWSLSGIYREVTLFAVPAAHLRHYTTRTWVNDEGSAFLNLWLRTSAPTPVKGRLIAPDGQPAGDLEFTPGEEGRATGRLAIPHPQLWTAETPWRYTLELELGSGQRVVEKIGLREVRTYAGTLRLNGRPIKLRGVNHHDLWPETGRVADEAQLRRDLALIQAANCNFVRTAHYPPHPRLIELCDELGLYVMDEVPFGFGEEHLNDAAYRESLLTRARATVRRDANHPSVIVWSVGNENPNTPLTLAAAREVKQLDPSRPVCFPQIGSYFAKSYGELPSDIDLYAPHYPSTATMRDYAERLARPVIFTEYAHALGLATDLLQVQWPVILENRNLAGGAVWMFQDQGLRRAARPGETPAATHDLGLNVWPDPQHYFDSHGNQGMDGIVYSDRTPQTDYWQVRKVYSPVQVTPERQDVEPGQNFLPLHVENRFDFRSLEGITLTWSLRRNGREVERGTHGLPDVTKAGAMMAGTSFMIPRQPGADIYSLAVECREGERPPFYERSFRLRACPCPPIEALAGAGSAGAPRLTETPERWVVAFAGGRATIERATGAVELRDHAGRLLARGFQPHMGRRLTEGEFVRQQRENPWPRSPWHTTLTNASASQEGDEVAVRLSGSHARSDAPDSALAGSCDLRFKADGSIEVAYDYQVSGSGLLLEAGWEMSVPAEASEFRWIGAGPYAGYPGKDALNEFGLHHLGRDDLYFQGNRREVELALLTTPQGAGVALGGTSMDVAVERDGASTVFSHNAVLSGRGNKFVGPEQAVKAEDQPRIAGKFTVCLIPDQWPKVLRDWFGDPGAAAPFRPFFHSYDQ